MKDKKDFTLRIKKIPAIDLLVIEKLNKGDQFFLTNERSIAISVGSLATLINFLVKKGYFSPKVLEGILEEYYDCHEGGSYGKRI